MRDAWDCFPLAGLAGWGGGQVTHADRTGPAAERTVWSPEHFSSEQLCAGPGEVQYLYRAVLFRLVIEPAFLSLLIRKTVALQHSETHSVTRLKAGTPQSVSHTDFSIRKIPTLRATFLNVMKCIIAPYTHCCEGEWDRCIFYSFWWGKMPGLTRRFVTAASVTANSEHALELLSCSSYSCSPCLKCLVTKSFSLLLRLVAIVALYFPLLSSPDGSYTEEQSQETEMKVPATDFDDEFDDEEPLPTIGTCKALYTFEGITQPLLSFHLLTCLVHVPRTSGKPSFNPCSA